MGPKRCTSLKPKRTHTNAYLLDHARAPVPARLRLQGELETKSKFWGKSVEVFLYGCESLRTKPWGDEFRWSRATICVSDVILGNYWVQVRGQLLGACPTSSWAITGCRCVGNYWVRVRRHPGQLLGPGAGAIIGCVSDVILGNFWVQVRGQLLGACRTSSWAITGCRCGARHVCVCVRACVHASMCVRQSNRVELGHICMP